jgi:hypothetical protein
MDRLGLTIDQVTCFIGDNAYFNDAIAKYLGVTRLRCMPHSLALVFAELTCLFPLYTTTTSGLSAVLTAGGSVKRVEAVKEAKLLPSNLHCVTTRWGSTQGVCRELLSFPAKEDEEGKDHTNYSAAPTFERFEVVRRVMTDHPAFQLPPAKKAGKSGKAAAAPPPPPSEEEVEDVEVMVQPKGRGKVKLTSLLLSVREAFEVGVPVRRHQARLELCLVEVMASHLPLTMELFSADLVNMKWELALDTLEKFEQALEDAAEPGNQQAVFEKAFKRAKCRHEDKDAVSYSLSSPLPAFSSHTSLPPALIPSFPTLVCS